MVHINIIEKVLINGAVGAFDRFGSFQDFFSPYIYSKAVLSQ